MGALYTSGQCTSCQRLNVEVNAHTGLCGTCGGDPRVRISGGGNHVVVSGDGASVGGRRHAPEPLCCCISCRGGRSAPKPAAGPYTPEQLRRMDDAELATAIAAMVLRVPVAASERKHIWQCPQSPVRIHVAYSPGERLEQGT